MDQLLPLVEALNHLAESLKISSVTKYTLTGAQDWPILLVVGALLVAMISFMWVDLKATFKDHKADNKDEIDTLWNETRSIRQEMKECKEKCCG